VSIAAIRNYLAEGDLSDPELRSYLLALLDLTSERIAAAERVAANFRDVATAEHEKGAVHALDKLLISARTAASYELEQGKLDVGIQGTDQEVYGPRGSLERIFQNLFLNAAQQSRLYGILTPRLRVSISGLPMKDGQNLFEVSFVDNGPGIHACDFDSVFDPRYTTKEKGSGMGLYVVRKEMSKLGGSASVQRAILGVGTCFRLVFPIPRKEKSSK